MPTRKPSKPCRTAAKAGKGAPAATNSKFFTNQGGQMSQESQITKHRRKGVPFAEGGGGNSYEFEVISLFVVLMETGGFCPCFDGHAIINKIELQGWNRGYNTDDFIVHVEDMSTKGAKKLLAQVKHSVTLTVAGEFEKILRHAWNDYTNPSTFNAETDRIALVTVGANCPGISDVQWLLEEARENEVDGFMDAVEREGSEGKKARLRHIKNNLNAIKGSELSDIELHGFMKIFCLVDYNFGSVNSGIFHLLLTHLHKTCPGDERNVFTHIFRQVSQGSSRAATITPGSINIPSFRDDQPLNKSEISPDSLSCYDNIELNAAAFLVLVGGWDNASENDVALLNATLSSLCGKSLGEISESLQSKGLFTVDVRKKADITKRGEKLALLGPNLTQYDISCFGEFASSVINSDKRVCSKKMKESVVEGLVLLRKNSSLLSMCPKWAISICCKRVVTSALENGDWFTSGKFVEMLLSFLHISEDAFFHGVRKAVDKTLSDEGNQDPVGRIYTRSVTMAVEQLAKQEKYFTYSCIILAKVSLMHNRAAGYDYAFGLLVMLLQPLGSATNASADKKRTAFGSVLREFPNIGWKILLEILPRSKWISFDGNKPIWSSADDDKKQCQPGEKEYWREVDFYANTAIDLAGSDASRLAALSKWLVGLPDKIIKRLLGVVSSDTVTSLPDEERAIIWECLVDLIKRHRDYPDAMWALSIEMVDEMEKAANLIAPQKAFNLNRRLFNTPEYKLHLHKGSIEDDVKHVLDLRDNALREIYQSGGIDDVLLLAQNAEFSYEVGYSVAAISDETINAAILPGMLACEKRNMENMAKGYVVRMFSSNEWEWVDSIDRSDWTDEEKSAFLKILPFNEKTWQRVLKWLPDSEGMYWSGVSAFPNGNIADPITGVNKLIKHKRHGSAMMFIKHSSKDHPSLNEELKLGILKDGKNCQEECSDTFLHYLYETLQEIQGSQSVGFRDKAAAEFGYLYMMINDGRLVISPIYIGFVMAQDPSFFCQIMEMLYKVGPTEHDSVSHNIAEIIFRGWKTPPGTAEDGSFDQDAFSAWISHVKKASNERGLLSNALRQIGEVLIYSPPSKDLWIHECIAKELDDTSNDEMRKGYYHASNRSEVSIEEGFDGFAPKENTALKYSEKADSLEKAGYILFAVTLRDTVDVLMRKEK